MNHTFYFEKLNVWQNAKALVKMIYIETVIFSREERFGIINQLYRATLSISANIAEDMSREGNKDKLKFLNQAYSSAVEVSYFLILSCDHEFFKRSTVKRIPKLR